MASKSDPLKKLRELCLALPEAHEVKAWGEPTFRVKNKLFAMYAAADNHHGAGRPAVWIKAEDGEQEVRIRADPERYFRPPYVGPGGWVGVQLDRRVSWAIVGDMLATGWRLVVPKKLLAARPLLFALGLLLAAALPAEQVPSDAAQAAVATARAEIAAASRAFSDAFVKGDLMAVGDCYTEDALVLPPGRTVRGREQIRRFFTPAQGRKQLAHEMRSEELVLNGDLAIDVGSWVSTVQRGEGAPVTDSERYLAVWQRSIDGRWRMRYDMWHRPAPDSSPPPPALPPAPALAPSGSPAL